VEEAMPLFIFLGAGILALALVLVGIFALGRSRQAPEKADSRPASPSAGSAESASSEALHPSAPEPIRIHVQDDGSFSVEIEGRRFTRLSDVMNDRLVQRAKAAISAIQKFADVMPEVGPAPVELNNELRAGYLWEDGTFIVEFRGQRYHKLTEIHDGEIGRGVLGMIGKLDTFAQGLAVPPPAPPIKPSEQKGTVEEEFLRQLAAPSAEPKPLKMPGLMESLRDRPSKAEPMPVGIAGQIETILQQQLLDNTFLLGRSIHIVTMKDGSLGVQVEGKLFKWPDEVEPIVREAVQNAIRVWEKSG
jgi:hypothetical protein